MELLSKETPKNFIVKNKYLSQEVILNILRIGYTWLRTNI